MGYRYVLPSDLGVFAVDYRRSILLCLLYYLIRAGSLAGEVQVAQL